MTTDHSTWKKYTYKTLQIGKVKNPTVLAFSAYFHDSSSCIIKNGKIIAAVDEERFTRKKHDANFPTQAVSYCLKEAKVKKIDAVVFYEDPDEKWKRVKNMLKCNRPPKEMYDNIISLWKNFKSKQKIQEKFEQVTGLKNKIIFLDHHLSHAASSYFVSGFDEATVVTIDGVGEKNTTTLGYAKGNNITLTQPTDYMLMVYPIKKDKQKLIPAVTHVDGSGRLQTIRKHQNHLYYKLIKEFGKISGVPILVNTSFNIRGEPIVCTPHDAYHCMMGTEIDCLIMGKFLVYRKENLKDKWDAEVKE